MEQKAEKSKKQKEPESELPTTEAQSSVNYIEYVSLVDFGEEDRSDLD